MTPEEFVPAIPNAAVILHLDGRISALNAAAEGLFGAAILGRHYVTAFRQPALIERIEAALDRGEAETGRFIGRDGERDTSYAVTITPVGARQRREAVVVVFEDRTLVEEAGERRSEFVANVSHELRTPLTAISGFIETLRGSAREDAEARERFLEIMERETRRMNRLVDDLLSLARVEDLERVRPQEPVNVAGLLAGVVRGLAPLAETRQVTLSLSGSDLPVWAPGDADQLTQVFANLVENAIKYGREGGRVQIGLDRLETAPFLKGPVLRVTVSDEGEGIDPRHLGRLTERFYRVDSHRSRGMGGTGLGLSIVKHIVNRHRGRLRIESVPGKGSVFTVFLPQD